MPHWNYRVILHKSPNNIPEDDALFLHEVFYSSDTSDDVSNITSYTQNPIAASGETLSSVQTNLHQMMEALSKPILVEKDDKLVEYKPDV